MGDPCLPLCSSRRARGLGTRDDEAKAIEECERRRSRAAARRRQVSGAGSRAPPAARPLGEPLAGSARLGLRGRFGSALCADLFGLPVGAARDQRSQCQERHELQQDSRFHHHAENQDPAQERDEAQGHQSELPRIPERHERRHEVRCDPEQRGHDVGAEGVLQSRENGVPIVAIDPLKVPAVGLAGHGRRDLLDQQHVSHGQNEADADADQRKTRQGVPPLRRRVPAADERLEDQPRGDEEGAFPVQHRAAEQQQEPPVRFLCRHEEDEQREKEDVEEVPGIDEVVADDTERQHEEQQHCTKGDLVPAGQDLREFERQEAAGRHREHDIGLVRGLEADREDRRCELDDGRAGQPALVDDPVRLAAHHPIDRLHGRHKIGPQCEAPEPQEGERQKAAKDESRKVDASYGQRTDLPEGS